MYEARQNKEKVSRRIDANGTRQRAKKNEENIRVKTQLTFDSIEKKGKSETACIQLLKMRKYALWVDFYDENRRVKYFSQDTIDFYNKHFNKDKEIKEEDIDETKGRIISDNISHSITFLLNPYFKEISISTISNNLELLRNIIEKIDTKQSGNSFYRNDYEDKYTLSPLSTLLKYNEVMFVEKNKNIYFAPNYEGQLKLSHPSLLGGYPYEVDDAGTLRENQQGKIEATTDSGHYYDGNQITTVNKRLTDLLNPSTKQYSRESFGKGVVNPQANQRHNRLSGAAKAIILNRPPKAKKSFGVRNTFL